MLFRLKAVVLAGILVLSFIFSVNSAVAEKRYGKNSCRPTISGLYIGKIPGLTTFAMSNTPLNASHNEMLIVIDTTGDADPTARGLFPTAIGQSNPRGHLIRKNKHSQSL